MRRKNKTPAYIPGGRLERTLMEINRKKAAMRWRRKAFKLTFLVLLGVLLGIGLVIYRMEQQTLWLSQKYALNLPAELSLDLFQSFIRIR